MTNFKIELLVSDKENLQNEYGKEKNHIRLIRENLIPQKILKINYGQLFLSLKTSINLIIQPEMN